MRRSRLAPTPSGYLHLGNGVNFVITWLLTRLVGGGLVLRIDDADAARCRPEYVEDVFRQLEWLGLDWDEGPQGPDEVASRYSQQLRTEQYRDFLARLIRADHAYRCDCSRKQIAAVSASGIYPGLCRQRQPPPAEGAWRLLVPEETMICVAGEQVCLAEHMGDFILWRRDNSPAYQLASVVDDLDMGINFIVRGADLLVSSAAQLYLAHCLGQEAFGRITFLHHDLITADQGKKLSKSDQALSLRALRQHGVPSRRVYQAAASLLGLPAANISTLADFDNLLDPWTFSAAGGRFVR